MNAKAMKIAVEDQSDKLRKITKIIPYADGGFGVLVPYHSARNGYLFKTNIPDPEPGRILVLQPTQKGIEYQLNVSERHVLICRPSESDSYSADDRVKLSFHPDGFVQFSGENPGKILSGRHADGEPKGLGLMTRNPMSNPIASGPTFVIVVWGVSDFEELNNGDPDVIKFALSELYYRNCTPQTANGIVIEGFILPAVFWHGVRGDITDLRLQMVFRGFLVGGAVIDIRVMQLDSPDYLLGIMVNRTATKLPADSGFQLCSPRDRQNNCIFAIYPSPDARTMLYSLKYSGPRPK